MRVMCACSSFNIFCFKASSFRSLSVMSTSMIPTKKIKLSKIEKKIIQKANARLKKQERKRSLDDFAHYENSDLSDYYFENGLRKAYAKRRWIGRDIQNVLLEEFNSQSTELIPIRCASGDIQVNTISVTPDYVLKDSDLLSHKVHRHELPVLNDPIKFVFENEDVLVLSKTASIPVHPCGQYTLNSMVHILAKEYKRRPLRFIHRLDRMTSGLMIAAKNYDASLRLATQISDREVKKYYVCEVNGRFPDSSTLGEKDSDLPPRVIACNQPLGPLCSKLGINAVRSESEGGKSARTHFMSLIHNPKTDSSLVLCRLFTGRTHQIRVHLQYLGYPIVQDPLYNTADWGPLKGKGADYGMPLDELVQNISSSRTVTSYLARPENNQYEELTPLERFTARLDKSTHLSSLVRDRLLSTYDPSCPDCQRVFLDPELSNLILRLHAFRYSGSDWCYTAPLPDWAASMADLTLSDLTELIESSMAKLL